MLCFVRATRASLVQAMATDPTASLGPDSPTGWTAVQVDSPEDLPSEAPALLVDQLDEVVELAVRDAAGEEHLAWSIDSEELAGSAPGDLDCVVGSIGLLLDLTGAERTALATVIAERPDGEVLAGALGEAVGLPCLALPTPRSAIMLARFGRAGMRATGMMAASHLGRVTFAELDERWSCLIAEEEPEQADALAMAVGHAMGAGNIVVRRRRALLLWRGVGEVCGAAVVHRGKIEASMSWGSVWDEPALASWEARDWIADDFMRLADPVAADLHGLRALFRSPFPPRRTLWPRSSPASGGAAADRILAVPLGIPERTRKPRRRGSPVPGRAGRGGSAGRDRRHTHERSDHRGPGDQRGIRRSVRHDLRGMVGPAVLPRHHRGARRGGARRLPQRAPHLLTPRGPSLPPSAGLDIRVLRGGRTAIPGVDGHLRISEW